MMEKTFLTDLLQRKNDPKRILDLLRDLVAHTQVHQDSKTPYSRNVLHSDEQCEVMIARWNPDFACAPHDHGASAGYVFYLEGDFQEIHYDWKSNKLVPTREVLHAQGSYTQVGSDDIHSCMATRPGLTLHVYFPCIEAMRVYDLENERTLLLASDCGAWIPHDPRDIKEETQWLPSLRAAI